MFSIERILKKYIKYTLKMEVIDFYFYYLFIPLNGRERKDNGCSIQTATLSFSNITEPYASFLRPPQSILSHVPVSDHIAQI